ncbi:MAG: CoA transferase [Pseudomonadales bacterium]|nr:CoA transferase [Pseudomonadales bacterium]
MNQPFTALMAIRDREAPTETITFTGQDPVLPSRFRLGETAAGIFAAIGVAVNDIWALRGRDRQQLSIDVAQAAAALRSYQYFRLDNAEAAANWAQQRMRQQISMPHPTRDGRYFLPHMGLPNLAEKILKVLNCEYELDSVVNAVAKWDALDLEDAIAAAGACGAMIRTEAEWLSHPQGALLASRPVIEILRIGDSEPEPFPELPAGGRPLTGLRVLDLTRILAGPTCARTLAEHGADVLMVTAPHLPQADMFVKDTSHGKRSCFLDLNNPAEHDRLLALVKETDVFSQGYRPGVLAARGLAPETLASIRPGIVYTSMNCYGFGGPFGERAGWEQLAQSVTGLAHEQGDGRPTLLPAAACDYTTGYLAALGTLIALARRATEGGSYHVRASLCQSGMFLSQQGRVGHPGPEADIPLSALTDVITTSHTAYGEVTHLGPVLGMSETPPHWVLPSPPLGTHKKAEWLPR